MCKNSNYSKSEKEGNVLFNNTINTFYLRSYGIWHTFNPLHPAYHSGTDNERETHCLHFMGYPFWLSLAFSV